MKKYFAAGILSILFAGCAATNAFTHMTPDYSDLPEDDLRQLASAIEAIVTKGEENFTLDSTGGIKADSPELLQAIRTRIIRYPLITTFLDTGHASEQNNGLITVLRSSAYKKATTSQQRDRDALVVMDENKNRWTIYEGLLEENNWPPKSLSAIQEIFFDARVPLMADGQKHEAPRAN